MLVSAVQNSDSVRYITYVYIYIYISDLFITYYKILSTVPCAIQEVLVGYLVYNSTVCILSLTS